MENENYDLWSYTSQVETGKGGSVSTFGGPNHKSKDLVEIKFVSSTSGWTT